mmetsp:Transcript_14420/g.33442  ORF Transcript_14420/g.33442 Transcript_14420/m.33442 type:complete len:98 (-) Transcript_14420:573-866(-)
MIHKPISPMPTNVSDSRSCPFHHACMTLDIVMSPHLLRATRITMGLSMKAARTPTKGGWYRTRTAKEAVRSGRATTTLSHFQKKNKKKKELSVPRQR